MIALTYAQLGFMVVMSFFAGGTAVYLFYRLTE